MTTLFRQKCTNCKQKTNALTFKDYTKVLEHDGREYTVTVPKLEIVECTNCGHQVVPDDSFDLLVDQLRKQAGLLLPSEIREKRKQLDLTQEQLATLLGVAPATICRWESGGQIQQRTMNELLNAFFDLQTLRNYLMEKHGMLPITIEDIPCSVEMEEIAETTEATEIRVFSVNGAFAYQRSTLTSNALAGVAA